MSPTLMPLTLAGPYCDLGSYADLIYKHNEATEVSISLATEFSDLNPSQPYRQVPFVDLAVPRTRYYPRSYHYARMYDAHLPRRGQIRTRLTFTQDEPFGPSLSRIEISGDGIGAARFVRTISGERTQHWRVYTKDLPPQSIGLDEYARGFFPQIVRRRASYARSSQNARKRIRAFVSASQLQFHFMERLLSQSEVVGPFRTPPERRYAFGGFTSSRGDPTGERAVDLLITESLLAEHEARPLQQAASFWIRHLGLADSLKVKDIAKRLNLFELDVAGAGRGTKANLADVGFGISQILPVLIQGLLMRPGGIYIIQQPEIHLHPDAQAGLADFFIYLASYGVMTVVETHSEYFLLRLRRRLAEGGIPMKLGLPPERNEVPPLTRKDVAVLLTGTSDTEDALVTELEIGDSFQFENLPDGFMSQAIDDRIQLLKVLGKTNG